MKKVKTNYEKGLTAPVVFITQNRQRIKQYDKEIVFLKNGEEFELELFNPTQEKVLAEIYLNGIKMDSGIVLRPGERVFLERYLDEARKFVFDTYEVDGNDPNVDKAIEKNGLVEVEFYKECKPIHWNYTYTYNPSITTPSPDYVYYHDTHTSGNPITYTLTHSGDNTVFNCNYEAKDNIVNSNNIETGRVEKGSHSNQSFVYDNTSFNSWWTWKKSWKILPKSRKAVVKEDLSVYCTSCGAKRKKSSHKFCPHCGNKF